MPLTDSNALPAPPEMTKGGKILSMVSEVLPMLLAGATGNPKTVQQTAQGQDRARAQNYERNEMEWGRAVLGSKNKNITAEQIMQSANQWGVKPDRAMQMAMAFMQFKQGQQATEASDQKQGTIDQVMNKLTVGGDGVGPTQPMTEQDYAGLAATGSGDLADQLMGRGKWSPGEGRGMQLTEAGVFDPTTGQIIDPNTKKPVRPGISLKSGPEGLTFTEGMPGVDPGASPSLGKTTANKVEGQLLDAADSLASLRNIKAKTDVAYLDWGKRLGQGWSAFKEKTNSIFGWNPTPAEKEDLSKYSAWKQDSLENVNGYIQKTTGAQVNKDEIPRIMAVPPNPGVGYFDGDSPTEFVSKLNNQIKVLRKTYSRLYYLRQHGLTDRQIEEQISSGAIPMLDEKDVKSGNGALNGWLDKVGLAALEKAEAAGIIDPASPTYKQDQIDYINQIFGMK